VSVKPTASPEAILVRTRFSYPRATFRALLLRIGLRGAIVLVCLLALFALWTALHLWQYPAPAFHYHYR
jgi:hypothetical protein